jgi:tetratricopeptide (TPR) repeat protein
MSVSSASHPTSAAPGEARPRRFRLTVPLLLTLLLLDSAYLVLANYASGPPRIVLSAFSYEGALLMHLLLGLLAAGYVVRRFQVLLSAIRAQKGLTALLGALALLCLSLCLLTGLGFVGIGLQWLSLGTRPLLRLIHDVATVGFLGFGLLSLLLRARSKQADTIVRKQAITATRLGLLCGIPFAGLLAYTLFAPNTDRKIANPALPPLIPFDEGEGRDGKFFPASVESVDSKFFPSAYFMDSKSCGVKGCHPDIYTQWESSAHHRASFNNQWYRKSIEYMQEVIGTRPSKWCGGCHDMAVLLTEDPRKPGRSRFDKPIAEQNWPPEKYPEAHAGIGCAVCHSIVHVKSTMGNSDYLADYPPMHKYIDINNPLARGMHNFLTRLAPEPHKKTFLRPFHREQTAKFCSACHKVHLDVPVNNYRWFRGFNDYDAWQQSGVSGFGAASFYYPSDEKTGKPAFKKCADCHMPTTPSQDAGSFGGQVHSHRFPAANTALPFVYHDRKQMEATTRFLTDKALSIDIFALRRQKAGALAGLSPANTMCAGPSSAFNARGAGANARSAPALPQRSDTPQAASLNGDVNGMNVTAANVSNTEETLVAPLNRGGAGAALRRGESPLIDVVVRTLKLGHAFPGGTLDAFDIWVELEARDDRGRTLYHSGKLQWPDGPVEEGAERYRALLVDGHSNPINKRNAWAARAVVYAKVIPPGAADTVHFRLKVPGDCGSKVTLTAKLNYRKFTWWNTRFAYTGRSLEPESGPLPVRGSVPATVPVGLGVGKKTGPVAHGWDDRPMHFDGDTTLASGEVKEVPNLPVVVLAQDTITLPVVDATAKPDAPATPGDAKRDRIRWNDYGIGLLLQGDFRHATSAFEQVTRLSPQWPEGYVNIGRVRQAERDSKAAQAAFEKAFALYDARPTPMTPYQRARTQFFYAQTLFDQGRLDESLATLDRVAEVFPEDRNARNLAGTILFRLGRYDEAIAQLRKTLAIDAEDVAAHYNLMKCYRAKGDSASLQEAGIHLQLYKRFKADETTTDLIGPYQRAHPADNNLAQRIHEHGDAICNPPPAWLKVRQAKEGPAKGTGG